jgi:transposase-like protein
MIREKIRGGIQPGSLQGLLEAEVQAVLTETVNQMLSQEQAESLGRGRYERQPGSVYRNGFKSVGIPGFFGKLWLRQPVLRRGGPGSSLLRALRQAGQARVAKRDRKEFVAASKAIFWAESKAEGLQALGRFQGTWQEAYPRAVGLVVAGAEASMRFHDEPKALWVTLRSTNLIERFNKETRRRFRPAGTMHSENAVLKLFWAVATEQEKRWSRRRVRGGRTMDMQAANQAEASSAERLAA